MNYLQLVQQAKIECGVSGSVPLNVTELNGELLRLANWVKEAYIAIQNERSDWRWLNKSAAIPIPSGERIFHPVQNWGIYPLKYDLCSFWLEDGNGGERDLTHWEDKKRFRKPVTGVPTAFTELPSREILFNALTDKPYILHLDYQSSAEMLGENDDVPSMPEQYHWAIIWKAVSYYAGYEEVPLLRNISMQNYMQIFQRMLVSELPAISKRGPLA